MADGILSIALETLRVPVRHVVSAETQPFRLTAAESPTAAGILSAGPKPPLILQVPGYADPVSAIRVSVVQGLPSRIHEWD